MMTAVQFAAWMYPAVRYVCFCHVVAIKSFRTLTSHLLLLVGIGPCPCSCGKPLPFWSHEEDAHP
jgi:hypothetical protein